MRISRPLATATCTLALLAACTPGTSPDTDPQATSPANSDSSSPAGDDTDAPDGELTRTATVAVVADNLLDTPRAFFGEIDIVAGRPFAAGTIYSNDGPQPTLWQLDTDGSIQDTIDLPVPDGHTTELAPTSPSKHTWMAGDSHDPDGSHHGIIWDITDQTEPAIAGTVDGHIHNINTIDGQTVATGSDHDSNAALWTIADDGTATQTFPDTLQGAITAAGKVNGQMWALYASHTQGDPARLYTGDDPTGLTEQDLPEGMANAHRIDAVGTAGPNLYLGGQDTDGMAALWRIDGDTAVDVTAGLRGDDGPRAGSITEINYRSADDALWVQGPASWWAVTGDDGFDETGGFGYGDVAWLGDGTDLRAYEGKLYHRTDGETRRLDVDGLGEHYTTVHSHGVTVMHADYRGTVLLDDADSPIVLEDLPIEEIHDVAAVDGGAVIAATRSNGIGEPVDGLIVHVADDGTVTDVTAEWDADWSRAAGITVDGDTLIVNGYGESDGQPTSYLAVSEDGGQTFTAGPTHAGVNTWTSCGGGWVRTFQFDAGTPGLARVSPDGIEPADTGGLGVQSCAADGPGDVLALDGTGAHAVTADGQTTELAERPTGASIVGIRAAHGGNSPHILLSDYSSRTLTIAGVTDGRFQPTGDNHPLPDGHTDQHCDGTDDGFSCAVWVGGQLQHWTIPTPTS